MSHIRCRKRDREREREREREIMESIKSGTGMCDVMTQNNTKMHFIITANNDTAVTTEEKH